MENVVFTQLSIPEIRELFRQELQSYFSDNQPNALPPADELLTIEEAAAFLNLKVPTIYGKVSRSEIPFSKQGKKLYFSKQELTDWIKTGRKKTLTELAGEADTYLQSKRK